MAYAVLVSLAQTMEKILHNHDQYSISPHEKQQIISIHEYIIFLQAFLEDFPEKANSLEGQIRDVANEAEDIMEDFILEHIRQHHISKIQSVMSMCLKKRHHFDFQELERVTGEIDSIARHAMEIKKSARSTGHSRVAASSSSRVLTAPASKNVAIVGFEEDLLAIKGRLCGESSKLEVIPIYGMGGIGKTTLARNAYDDQSIVEHFHLRAWVTISQDYSAPRMLSSLLLSVGAECSEDDDESKMAEKVYKSLKGRRYVIVIDDMWDTKVWDDVRRILPNDHNHSRIVLTTRLLDVAAYPGPSTPPHEMHFMDLDQSWNLLCLKVFKKEHCPPELENIGKEIARRCRGLPLAIIVIAGILSTSEAGMNQAYWEEIARNVSEVVTENNEQFADIVLSLSYKHLPQHLKPCFLYMGGFPEDYEIRMSKLIKLYVAEGFLKLPNESKSCEEAAEEYLEDLVRRSLVLVNRRKSNGKIKSCSVHDLVRNLCIRQAQEDKFFLHVKDVQDEKILLESIKAPCRLSIQCVLYPNDSLRDTYGRMSVRTVLYFERDERFLGISRSFKLLRVLDAVNIRFGEFPVEVLELFHLRYLALRYMEGFEFHVPSSILKLENLQTLFICPYSKILAYMRSGIGIVPFPSEIWRMSQLRHILVFNLDGFPSDHALENLQTLAQVTDFKCTKRMVQMVPNLKKLGIYFKIKRRTKWRLYQLHNLVQMHQLEVLKICVESKRRYARFWKNLAFPPTLKKLNLWGFLFTQQDLATVGLLPNLQVLKLGDCCLEEDEWITSEGEFCRLKLLQFRYVDLVRWITERSHFPILEQLRLYDCRRLVDIPDDIGEIPTLKLIEVHERNKSLVESARRIQEEQQSLGNEALQVRVLRGR